MFKCCVCRKSSRGQHIQLKNAIESFTSEIEDKISLQSSAHLIFVSTTFYVIISLPLHVCRSALLHVICQFRLQSESFVADFASVWSLAMHVTNVMIEVAKGAEPPGTIGAYGAAE